MIIVALPIQVLHEFHHSLKIELQEWEQRTSLLTMQVEKEKASLKKELEKLAKQRDDTCFMKPAHKIEEEIDK